MASSNDSNTTGIDVDFYDTRTTVITATIQVVLTTAVILANLFGIFVMLYGRMWQRPSEVVLISLCLADLGVGSVMPMSIVPIVLSRWPFGERMCVAFTCLNTLFLMMSITGLVLFSIDKLLAIVWPYWYLAHVTMTRARNICIAVWLTDLACATGPVIGWTEHDYHNMSDHCFLMLHDGNEPVRKYIFGAILLTCITVVTVTNIIIAKVLQKHRRKITHHDVTYRVNTTQHYRDIFRSYAALQYMTLTALVTLLPAVVVVFLTEGQPQILYTIGLWFMYSNSLWNIIIYSYRMSAFRLRAKQLWCSMRRVVGKCCFSNKVGPMPINHIS